MAVDTDGNVVNVVPPGTGDPTVQGPKFHYHADPYSGRIDPRDRALERIADALEKLVLIGEALGQIAEEALGRMRSPGGFRATAGPEAEAELVDQDDADLARIEAEDARRDLTEREREAMEGLDAGTHGSWSGVDGGEGPG